MRNLEQIRALHALNSAASVRGARANENGEGESGDAVSGYSSLIMNNGLLATVAFSLEKKGQYLAIAKALDNHLRQTVGVEILTVGQGNEIRFNSRFLESNSCTLRRCNEEALAFLSYLKRFAR